MQTRLMQVQNNAVTKPYWNAPGADAEIYYEKQEFVGERNPETQHFDPFHLRKDKIKDIILTVYLDT